MTCINRKIFCEQALRISPFMINWSKAMLIQLMTIGAVSIFFLPATCFSLELTLEQAVNIALENNSEIQLANLELEIKASEVKKQIASYIPTLSFDSSYTSSKDNPDSSDLKTKNQNYQTGIVQKLPLGGELSISANYGRSGYSASFSDSIDDNYYTGINLFFKQSLLKDGILGPSFALIKEKKFIRDIQKDAVSDSKINLVKLVETAFYQTALKQREKQIYQEIFKINTQLLNDLKSKLSLGLIPEIDVMSAQIKVNETKEYVLSSLASLETSLRTLKTLLDIKVGIKVISKFQSEKLSGDLKSLTTLALESNKELAQLNKNLQKDLLLLAVAKNRYLPQVDLYASIDRKDQGSTFGSTTELDETEYKAGIIFIYPFYPVDPKEAYLQAQKKVIQAKLQLSKSRLRISNEITMLYNQVKLIEEKLAVQTKQLKILKERMNLALKAFQERLIDLNMVYDIQDDRISGEQKYFYYLFEYQSLLSSIKQLTGQLILPDDNMQ
jgi:outer membrane protein